MENNIMLIEADESGELYPYHLSAQLPLGIMIGINDYNCYFPATSGNIAYLGGGEDIDLYTLAQWQSGTDNEINSFEADPLLEADYTLQDGSPCLRQSLSRISEDIAGNKRAYEAIDIGAYQTTESGFIGEGYCSTDDVIEYAGVVAQDLDLANTSSLKALISKWILQITDFINEYCGQSWEPSEVPAGVRNACLRMTASMVTTAIQKRKGTIVKIGEFSVSVAQDNILTKDVIAILSNYVVSKKSTRMGFGVVKREDED